VAAAVQKIKRWKHWKKNEENPLKSFVSFSPLICDTSQVALIGDWQSILRLHCSINWYSPDPNCTVLNPFSHLGDGK